MPRNLIVIVTCLFISGVTVNKEFKYNNLSHMNSKSQVTEGVSVGLGLKKSNKNHLTKENGVYYYGSQKETYYNLDMTYVVKNAHNNGIDGEYHIREDGCKMLGDYIMISANQSIYPYGSLVETSLGTGIVVDTGGFVQNSPLQVDIAVNW